MKASVDNSRRFAHRFIACQSPETRHRRIYIRSFPRYRRLKARQNLIRTFGKHLIDHVCRGRHGDNSIDRITSLLPGFNDIRQHDEEGQGLPVPMDYKAAAQKIRYDFSGSFRFYADSKLHRYFSNRCRRHIFHDET